MGAPALRERMAAKDLQLIVALVAKQPGLTCAEIAERLEIPMMECKGYMLRLTRRKLLQSTTTRDHPTTYEVIPEGHKPPPPHRDWLQAAFFGPPRKAAPARQRRAA